MSEETADSGTEESGIDMDAAMDEITDSIFDSKPDTEETTEETTEVVEEVIEDKKEASEEKKEEVNELPQSWKKDMQEKWDSVDPDTQTYFLQREAQMSKGDELRQQDATYGRTMRDVMEPYQDVFKQQGIDQVALLGQLASAHVRLSTADEAGKRELFNQLAKSYGIDMGGEAAPPEITDLQNRFTNIENQLYQSHQQAQQVQNEKTKTEIEAFASENELFDEVSEQIIMFINAGQDLETAYQSAIWQNPVTRQKEIDRMNKEAAEKSVEDAKLEAEKAKKAKATNIKGRDTKRTPTEPTGKMFDDMHDIYRELHN